MKTPVAILFALLLLLLCPSRSRASVSFEFFYDSLAPYGEWVELDDYGYCWRPTGLDSDWRPYMDGYWSYTDAGWTWVSYEDWGGLTYHYGRWVRVEDEGWCWVPGYEWGPAWVSWRTSDDYVGWAPLPPEVRFRREIGISVWVDRTYDIGPTYYNFCPVRRFGAPVLRGVIVDRSQNVTIINNTINVTNITVNEETRVVYNGGPDYELYRTRVERPIPTLKLVREDRVMTRNDGKRAQFIAEQRGNQLVVPAPAVTAPVIKVAPPKPVRVLPKAKVDKGWDAVKDPVTRKEIKTRMEKETAGLTPETAPAKPVKPAALAVIPKVPLTKPNAAAQEPTIAPAAKPGAISGPRAPQVETTPAPTQASTPPPVRVTRPGSRPQLENPVQPEQEAPTAAAGSQNQAQRPVTRPAPKATPSTAAETPVTVPSSTPAAPVAQEQPAENRKPTRQQAEQRAARERDAAAQQQAEAQRQEAAAQRRQQAEQRAAQERAAAAQQQAEAQRQEAAALRRQQAQERAAQEQAAQQRAAARQQAIEEQRARQQQQAEMQAARERAAERQAAAAEQRQRAMEAQQRQQQQQLQRGGQQQYQQQQREQTSRGRSGSNDERKKKDED